MDVRMVMLPIVHNVTKLCWRDESCLMRSGMHAATLRCPLVSEGALAEQIETWIRLA